MGRYVVVGETKYTEETQKQASDPPDLGMFLLGMFTGAVVTVVIEGVIVYFTWPILIGFVKGLVGVEAIREVL